MFENNDVLYQLRDNLGDFLSGSASACEVEEPASFVEFEMFWDVAPGRPMSFWPREAQL